MSRNTHLTFADNIRLLPGHSNHPCHLHTLPRFPELCSTPKLRSHLLPTLISTFSLSLVYCSSLTLPTCASHSCIHCLAVFPFTLPISPFLLLLHFRHSD